jgi:hypothetical protein
VFWMLICLFLALVAAGAVVVYVLYPRRDEDVPYAPWLGDAMRKGVHRLPTIDNLEDSNNSRR